MLRAGTFNLWRLNFLPKMKIWKTGYGIKQAQQHFQETTNWGFCKINWGSGFF
jgi:hypothetical protein